MVGFSALLLTGSPAVPPPSQVPPWLFTEPPQPLMYTRSQSSTRNAVGTRLGPPLVPLRLPNAVL